MYLKLNELNVYFCLFIVIVVGCEAETKRGESERGKKKEKSLTRDIEH